MKKAVWAIIAAFLLLQLASAAQAQVVGPAVRVPLLGNGGGGSSTITSGTTATSGCVAGGVLRSISNLVECGAGLTYNSSIFTVGTGASSVARKMEVANGTAASVAFIATHSSTATTLGGIGYVDLPIAVQNTSNTNNNYSFISFLNAAGATPAGILGRAVNQASQTGSLEFVTRGSDGLLSRMVIGTEGNVSIGPVSNTAVPMTINNGTSTGSPLVVQDNGAALPTTGATNTWNVRDGAIPQVGTGVLTSGTMTAEAQAYARGSMIHSATWTNAQVVALGAVTAGDIIAFTLPAKHVVENAYVVITGQGAGTTTLTVSCGRTGAGYIDYIVASDAQAAANTVYGDASGERGTNLTGYDLPSYTGTTAVTCNFVSTGANLDQVTGSTGRVVVITSLIP